MATLAPKGSTPLSMPDSEPHGEPTAEEKRVLEEKTAIDETLAVDETAQVDGPDTDEKPAAQKDQPTAAGSSAEGDKTTMQEQELAAVETSGADGKPAMDKTPSQESAVDETPAMQKEAPTVKNPNVDEKPTMEKKPSLKGKPTAEQNPMVDEKLDKDEELAEEEKPAIEETPKVQTFLLMTALCISVFLAALDITIVSTALPTISEHFHSTSGYVWVGSAFMLAAAASTPNWGKLSDIWGRKSMLLAASVVFIIGCALCGAAVSLSMLIVGRAVQGWGAGGLLTLVNIVIGDLFSLRERGKYYGMVGGVWAVASALGPVVGGALTDNVSWRWCFYINLPISGTAIIIIAFTLKLATTKTPFISGIKAMDWLGSLTITGSTIMLLLGLQFGGSSYTWDSPIVICLIVFGVVTFGVFVLVELYIARYPIIPLHLFANTSNLAIILVDLFHGLAFTQGVYFIPVYFQAVLGASPLLSGVWLLPFVLALSFSAMGVGIYLKKTGRYLDCIRLGFVLAVLGCGLLYDLPRSQSWAKIVVYQIIGGLGVGQNFQPPLVALQSNIPVQFNAAATASFALVRNLATAIAVVIGSVVFSNKMASQQNVLRSQLGDETANLLSGSNAQANLFLVDTLNGAQQQLVRETLYKAIRVIWIETVAFAAAGLLASFFITKRKLEKIHTVVKTGLEGEEDRRRTVLEGRAKQTMKEDESEV